MEKLQIINHPQFGALPYIVIDGKEYFAANECAAMLGYTVPKDAISRHCKGALKRRLPTKGGNQEVKLITEGDLWRLIIRSKLPQAEQIEKWIMDDVLPTIRKTGSYNLSQYKPPRREQPKLEEKPYEYKSKHFDGVAVLTIADAAFLLEKEISTIYPIIKRIGKTPTDYEMLTGDRLRRFKEQNPTISKLASSTEIIYQSGFNKLCKFFGVEIEMPNIKLIEEKKEEQPSLVFFNERHNKIAESIRKSAERLIHLTYLIDEKPGTMIPHSTLEMYFNAIRKEMRSIGNLCPIASGVWDYRFTPPHKANSQ